MPQRVVNLSRARTGRAAEPIEAEAPPAVEDRLAADSIASSALGLAIMAPISAGELIDKITILRVKAERLADPRKLANVKRELSLLERLAEAALKFGPRLQGLIRDLAEVNASLWDVEEAKRDCERRQDFGPEFIDLARAVYLENDRRAAIKRSINEETGSALVEEKSYRPYRSAKGS